MRRSRKMRDERLRFPVSVASAFRRKILGSVAFRRKILGSVAFRRKILWGAAFRRKRLASPSG
jgi:hypothetical protein